MAEFKPAKGNLDYSLPFEGAWPTSVAFLGSSRKLAAANQKGEIYVWDLPQTPTAELPPPVRRLDGHANGVTRLIATADGKTLYSASLDRTVRAWDLTAPATGSAEAILDSDKRQQEAKKGKKDALDRPGVKVATQTAAHVFSSHRDWVNGLGLSRDEKRLITSDDTNLTIVWDLAGKKEVSRWLGYPGVQVTSAALSPDGTLAFTAEYSHARGSFDRPPAQARFWNVADGKEKIDVIKVQFPNVKERDNSYGYAQVWGKFVAGGLICSEFSPDGKLLATGQGGETGTGRVHLLDPETGKLVRTVASHQEGITDLKFSADGNYLLTTGRDTLLKICQVSDGKEVLQLGKARGGQFKDWLHALAISPDQTSVAAVDIAGLVLVWSLIA